jgi:hypothetical protein
MKGLGVHGCLVGEELVTPQCWNVFALCELYAWVCVCVCVCVQEVGGLAPSVEAAAASTAWPGPFASLWVFFPLIHRSHSISFTRAQGIPKYKIGFGREKDGFSPYT